MTITIDWGTKIISVPTVDTTLVSAGPPQVRELDLDVFRLRLKDLEDDPEGMPFPQTHTHNTTVTVGGVTLARVIEIVNGYTVTFEDGQYAVNLVGANSNVGDVTNVNQVSIRSANSAGLIQVTSGSGLSAGEQAQLAVAATEATLARKLIGGRRAVVSLDDLTVTFYDDDNTTVLAIYDISADARTRTRQ